MRVLVVDDNPVNREILSKQLAAWGAAVETSADPEAVVALALAAARGGRQFAAVVLDQARPGLDGLSLARLIRAEPALAGLRHRRGVDKALPAIDPAGGACEPTGGACGGKRHGRADRRSRR